MGLLYIPQKPPPEFEIQHNVEIFWPYLQKGSKKYILHII